MTESDETLLAGAKQGNRPAFEELVRRTARLVFSRCYLEAGDVHQAEDLTQETFLVAWRSIRQVSDSGKLRPWLISIAHSTAIDAARRSGRKKRSAGNRADDREILRLADGKPTPPESIEQKEQREHALAVLRDLPDEYRQVLMLRYLGGADYETISRQLALSNGSLRGLLHRGLALLRSRMNAD